MCLLCASWWEGEGGLWTPRISAGSWWLPGRSFSPWKMEVSSLLFSRRQIIVRLLKTKVKHWNHHNKILLLLEVHFCLCAVGSWLLLMPVQLCVWSCAFIQGKIDKFIRLVFSIFFFYLGYFQDPVPGIVINFGTSSSEAEAKVGESLAAVIRYHWTLTVCAPYPATEMLQFHPLSYLLLNFFLYSQLRLTSSYWLYLGKSSEIVSWNNFKRH